MSAHRIGYDLHTAQCEIKDPGASGTITVDQSMAVCNLISAAAESRTLARPTKSGVVFTVSIRTAVGTVTLTVTGGFNRDGDTTFSLTTAGQWVSFRSYMTSAGVYYWEKTGDYALANISPADAAVLDELSALDATGDEIDRTSDLSARIVNVTATVLAVTVTEHSDRIIVLDAAAPHTSTLPAASGSGAKYTFIVNTAATGTAHKITCGTLDILKGFAHFSSTTTDDAHSFLTTATDDNISLNGTTKGGLGGDRIEIIDAKLSIYQISAWLTGSGTLETGFAAT